MYGQLEPPVHPQATSSWWAYAVAVSQVRLALAPSSRPAAQKVWCLTDLSARNYALKSSKNLPAEIVFCEWVDTDTDTSFKVPRTCCNFRCSICGGCNPRSMLQSRLRFVLKFRDGFFPFQLQHMQWMEIMGMSNMSCLGSQLAPLMDGCMNTIGAASIPQATSEWHLLAIVLAIYIYGIHMHIDTDIHIDISQVMVGPWTAAWVLRRRVPLQQLQALSWRLKLGSSSWGFCAAMAVLS